MSVSEFSSALKNKAIKEWFNTEKNFRESQRLENINILTNPTNLYRSAEKTAEKNSFIITKDTIKGIISELRGLQGTELEQATNIAFSAFRAKNVGAKVNRRTIEVGQGIPAVYFSTISFDTITSLVNNILNLKPNELSKSFEKGHVIGLNTELLRVTANRIASIDARAAVGAKDAKERILKELDNVIEYYKKLDYDSANIQPASDVPIYASVNKTISKTGKTKYLVEIQPKAANQASASEVQATIGSIRKLFDPGALTEKAMTKLIDDLIPKVSDPKFVQDLLLMRSSPSFLDMIGENVANSIRGTNKEQAFAHKDVLVHKVKLPKANLSELRSIISTELVKVKALKSKLSTKVPLRTITGNFFSLTSLQNLLNSQLQDVISAKMGDGDETKILNYQTGRFAASAKVERLTQSKEGMISAFYSYMKNPYRTFEPGFKQGSPKSRDPKLLISQSIRDIAATKVANKMRAVLV